VVQRWATGWIIRGSSTGRGWEFVLTTASRLSLGPTQSAIQWATGALPWDVKLQGREADYSPPSSAEV